MRVQSAPALAGEEQADWLEQLAARLSSPSRRVRHQELMDWVDRELANLREIDWQVLELELEGKTLSEIAAILDVTLTAAAMRRSRARDNLAKLLQASWHKYQLSSR